VSEYVYLRVPESVFDDVSKNSCYGVSCSPGDCEKCDYDLSKYEIEDQLKPIKDIVVRYKNQLESKLFYGFSPLTIELWEEIKKAVEGQ
jgi:hypothetical protein